MSNRAVIYARVSLDKTGEQASVERQIEACQALAVARGWDVVAVHTDNSISAYSDKVRPGWEQILGMVERGEIETIIAWHVDRMTRSMHELERLILLAEGHGVGVATATGDIDLTTDTGRMVARILAAVARQEVERKAARQKLANAQRAAQGRKTNGTRPLGYERDQVTIREPEAALIREAARSVLAGVPVSQVAKEWRARGVLTATGSKGGEERPGTWGSSAVRTLLKNPRYIGARVYLGEIVAEDAWPAVLDLETHEALLALFNDPSRRPREPEGGFAGANAQNLLSGIARCWKCKGPINAAPKGHNRAVDVYRCRKGCVQQRRDRVDLYVERLVANRLASADLAELAADVVDETEASELRERAGKIRRRLSFVMDQYMSELLSEEEWTRASASARAQLAEVEERLKRVARGTALDGLIGVPDAEVAWKALELGRKRAALEHMTKHIEIASPGRGVRAFIPETIDVQWSKAARS
jgi:DNA invertase Pin-like site-specific DNA recombinase